MEGRMISHKEMKQYDVGGLQMISRNWLREGRDEADRSLRYRRENNALKFIIFKYQIIPKKLSIHKVLNVTLRSLLILYIAILKGHEPYKYQQ